MQLLSVAGKECHRALVTRVGLFDDHDIVRAGFKEILKLHSDLRVVCEAATGGAAIAAIREHMLDVAVVDLGLPDISGIDVLRESRMRSPRTAVLILSGYSEERYGVSVLNCGASGFVSKSLAPAVLISAVRTVAAGHRYMSPFLTHQLASGFLDYNNQPAHLRLSEREFQIFAKLAVGKSVCDIASELDLSPKTINTYRARLLDKLNFKTNSELTQYAVRHDLMTPQSDSDKVAPRIYP